MDIMSFAPVAVICVAIAVTEICKKYIREDIFSRIVWIPPLIIGVAGAVLLGIDKKPAGEIAWDSLCYAASACYTVLIAKRVVK